MSSNLRVAFFGSDLFSLISLKRLVSMTETLKIANIDVFTRSIKPSGRSLKTLIDVPVGNYALEQNLPLFRVDTSRQIAQFIEKKYDLAVAVSFGKLIPGSFLSSLRYGGLNVHPLMLPKFSGSSPIQYAIMNDCETTGVTVQTLHPTKFDHGEILKQSAPINIGHNETYNSLRDRLAVVGADLLQNVVMGNLAEPTIISSTETYSLAPKIPPSLAEIQWSHMTSRQICCLERALGPLFSSKSVDIVKKKKQVKGMAKVILEDIKELRNADFAELTKPGDFCFSNMRIIVKTVDSYITIGLVKYECCGYEDPETFMKRLKGRSGSTENCFVSTKSAKL